MGVSLFHEGVWQVLADLIAEFRKRGETIPPEIMEDLRSARSLIQVLHANPHHSGDTTQIEVYLNNVEFYLMPKAHEKFGQAFVDQWMKKLEKARMGATEEGIAGSTASKFLLGMPKGTPWLRVRISEDIPQGTVETLARESGLLYASQEKGYLLVYGGKEELESFVKRMTIKFRGARKS
jgi:hypothetical protein